MTYLPIEWTQRVADIISVLCCYLVGLILHPFNNSWKSQNSYQTFMMFMCEFSIATLHSWTFVVVYVLSTVHVLTWDQWLLHRMRKNDKHCPTFDLPSFPPSARSIDTYLLLYPTPSLSRTSRRFLALWHGRRQSSIYHNDATVQSLSLL